MSMQDEYNDAMKLLRLIGLTVIVLLVLAKAGRCSTTKPQSNSLGVLQYNDNPYIYEAVGQLIEVTEVEGNMNLRIKPIGTYLLYDDTVMLCGLPVDKFHGITEPFLMTYRRQSSHMVKGVACHELLRVDQIVPKEQLGK
jgi:hypothetical protein